MAEHLFSHGYEFKQFNNMDNSTMNEDNDKEQHMCNKCSKSFPLKSELDNHSKKVHSIQCKRGFASSILVCDVCGKKFAKRRGLLEHIRFVHKKGSASSTLVCD